MRKSIYVSFFLQSSGRSHIPDLNLMLIIRGILLPMLAVFRSWIRSGETQSISCLHFTNILCSFRVFQNSCGLAEPQKDPRMILYREYSKAGVPFSFPLETNIRYYYCLLYMMCRSVLSDLPSCLLLPYSNTSYPLLLLSQTFSIFLPFPALAQQLPE